MPKKEVESNLVFDFAMLCAAILVFIIIVSPYPMIEACNYKIEVRTGLLGDVIQNGYNPKKSDPFLLEIPILEYVSVEASLDEVQGWLRYLDPNGATVYLRYGQSQQNILGNGALLRLNSSYDGCQWVYLRLIWVD